MSSRRSSGSRCSKTPPITIASNSPSPSGRATPEGDTWIRDARVTVERDERTGGLDEAGVELDPDDGRLWEHPRQRDRGRPATATVVEDAGPLQAAPRDAEGLEMAGEVALHLAPIFVPGNLVAEVCGALEAEEPLDGIVRVGRVNRGALDVPAVERAHADAPPAVDERFDRDLGVLVQKARAAHALSVDDGRGCIDRFPARSRRGTCMGRGASPDAPQLAAPARARANAGTSTSPPPMTGARRPRAVPRP